MIDVQTNSITADFILFHLYTDFRWKTLAQIQAEWRDWQVVMWWSPTFSYWNNWIVIWWNYWNSYWWVYKKFPFTLTSQHKIIIRQTWYWRWNNQAFCSIGSTEKSNLQYNNERDCWLNIPFWNRNNNEAIAIWISKSVNWTKYRWIYELSQHVATWETWEYNIEFEIDLKNQTAKRTVYAPSLLAWTMQWQLNSDWYNAILWMQYAHFRAWHYSDYKNQDIYTGEITIKRA